MGGKGVKDESRQDWKKQQPASCRMQRKLLAGLGLVLTFHVLYLNISMH